MPHARGKIRRATATTASFGILLLISLVPFALIGPVADAQIYLWTTIAGSAGYGSADGTNSVARFHLPTGIASDSQGNLYVADNVNDEIRKLTAIGTNWVVTTIAGLPRAQGSADGTNGDARFYWPNGLGTDRQGNVYVADTYNYAIRRLTPAGANWAVTTIAGTARTFGFADGTNGAAKFEFPYGAVVDENGNVFVADGSNNKIRKISPIGTNWVVSTIANVNIPSAIAMDSAGNLFVTERWNHCVVKVSPAGTNWVVSPVAGLPGQSGSAEGTNTDARFYFPEGIAVDRSGSLFVADTENYTIRKITPDGTNWIVSTIAGTAGRNGSADGAGQDALFYNPYSITLNPDGNVYIADAANQMIRRLAPSGTNWVVSTIAGLGGPGAIDGVGSDARFNTPEGVAVNDNGEAYVADYNNSTVRKITPQGGSWAVSTIAGSAGNPGTNDGAGLLARFNTPLGVAVDAFGNAFVADNGNHTIRKISAQNGEVVVSTIAGSPGVSGTNDGANSLFYGPAGIAVGRDGTLYVADSGNSTIRQVILSGSVWTAKTIAGLPGFSGYLDGSNSAARFSSPCGVAVDQATNIYVVEAIGYTVRKIAPIGSDWVVTTIAGANNSAGYTDGTNSSARFWDTRGIAVDARGVVFVADAINNEIRRVAPVGTNWVVTTIGGKGTIVGLPDFEGSADGTNDVARFGYPYGLAIDSSGNIYVADSWNNAIRLGVPLPPVLQVVAPAGKAFVFAWSAGPGEGFQVQYNTDLSSNWSDLGGPIDATNSTMLFSDQVGVNHQRFYRVARTR